MEPVRLPHEIYDFFDNRVGRSLMVKGEAGTGKTIFCLTLLEEIGNLDNSFYFSTRVSHQSLYSQFPWLKNRDIQENLIDASIDFLRILYPMSNTYPLFREKLPDEMRDVKKVEKAREVIKRMPGTGYDMELPEHVNRANLLALAKDGDIRELQDIYQRVDSRLPEPSLVIIDSLESLIERYRVNPTELIKALQKDLVEMSGVRLVIVLETAESTKWDYLVDGVISMKGIEESGRRLRQLILNKLRGIQINRPVYQFTLSGGKFRYFKPFSYNIPDFESVHEYIEDGEGSIFEKNGVFSTGSEDLDELMDGGYPRKSMVVLDIDERVPFSCQMNLFGPVIENFLLQNRGVLVMLSSKRNKTILYDWVKQAIGKKYCENINIIDFEKNGSIIGKQGKQLMSVYEHEIKEAYNELNYKTGGPILTISDWIGIEYAIGGKDLGESERKDIALSLMDIMNENSDLTIGLMGPGLSFADKQRYIADVHIKLFTLYNSLFMYGEKPNTNIYNISLSEDKHPKTNFIPLV